MSQDEVMRKPSQSAINATNQRQLPEDLDIPTLPKIDLLRRDEVLDDMEHIAKRAVALHLSEMGIEFTHSALESFYDLFNTHHNTLLGNLQRITQIQRRFKASPKDLKLLLREYDISLRELEDELIQTKDISDVSKSKKKDLETQAEKVMRSYTEEQEIDTQDPSYVFYSQHDDIVELVPPSHKRPKGIPPWLPQFPPDHTYLRTPNFLNRITDQKAVRTKVAEESRLGEKALDHLISYEIKLEKTEIVRKIPQENKKAEEVKEGEQKEKSEYNIWTKRNEKKFDIVKYADERLKYLERKKRKQEEKKKNIDHEYFNMITRLSFYNNGDDLVEGFPEVQPQHYLDFQFQQAIGSLATLKAQKEERDAKRKELQAEEDKKRDELKKQQSSKFEEFDAFDNTSNTFNNFENFENFGNENLGNENQDSAFTFGGEVSDSDGDNNDDDIEQVDKDGGVIIESSNKDDIFEFEDLPREKSPGLDIDFGSSGTAQKQQKEHLLSSDLIQAPTSKPPTEVQTPAMPSQSVDIPIDHPPPASEPPQPNDEERDSDEDNDLFDDVEI